MPRFPDIAPGAAGIYRSVFARVADRLAAVEGEVYPLHIGDSYLDPLEWAPLMTGEPGEGDRLARYAHPHGLPRLRGAASAWLAERAVPHAPDELVVTGGATHGLFCASGALLAPGDEVLVLAPHWPLIPGILRTAGGVPIEVPFYDRLAAGAAVGELVRPYINARTAAIYFNSPNNPTGRLLGKDELEGIAALAREHNLWVMADEVYAGFGFDEQAPLIASLPQMAERTISAFSFSKLYAMAGYRVGFLSGPADVVRSIAKVSTHTVYSVPVASQLLGARVLEAGQALTDRVRETYRAGARAVDRVLDASFAPADGGAFVFLDLRQHASLEALLDRCLSRGIALSPGEAFGASYSGWARLCFTVMPPERLEPGLRILNEVLAGDR